MANQRGQIVMSDDEVAEFLAAAALLDRRRPYGPQGQIHLVGMWYAVMDGQIWIETKKQGAEDRQPAPRPADARSSSRPATPTTSSAASRSRAAASSIEDEDVVWDVCVNIFERYNGAVHRGDEAVRGVHGQEPRRRPPRRRPGPLVGPPQARAAGDGAGREHGVVRRLQRIRLRADLDVASLERLRRIGGDCHHVDA